MIAVEAIWQRGRVQHGVEGYYCSPIPQEPRPSHTVCLPQFRGTTSSAASGRVVELCWRNNDTFDPATEAEYRVALRERQADISRN